MKKVIYLKLILFLVLVYLLCTRRENKYDEFILLSFGIIILIETWINRKYYKVDKKISKALYLWAIIVTISFIRMRINNESGLYIKLYYNILIDNFFLFFVVTQINLEKKIGVNLLIKIINIFSLYSVYKGVEFISKYGFFIRGDIWRNPNYYSMLLGIFMIVSFISFLYEEKIIYKLLYLILNLTQFFMMISIGQSRNVCVMILISYFIALGLFYYKCISLKNFIKIASGVLIILFFFLLIAEKNNLRVVEISLEEFLNNPRILIWKKALFEEKFNIFLGKGFAYYTMNSFNDSVGVNIWAVHNDSLEIFVTQGIFALLCYWSFIFFSLKDLINNFIIKRKKEVLLAIIVLIYFVGIGMLDLPLYHKRIAQFTFFFVALGISKEKKL